MTLSQICLQYIPRKSCGKQLKEGVRILRGKGGPDKELSVQLPLLPAVSASHNVRSHYSERTYPYQMRAETKSHSLNWPWPWTKHPSHITSKPIKSILFEGLPNSHATYRLETRGFYFSLKQSIRRVSLWMKEVLLLSHWSMALSNREIKVWWTELNDTVVRKPCSPPQTRSPTQREHFAFMPFKYWDNWTSAWQ